MASRESCAVWPAETSCFILVLCLHPFRSAVPLLLARPLKPSKLHCREAGGDMCAKGRSFLCSAFVGAVTRQEECPLHDARALSLLSCALCPCDLLSVDRDSKREIYLIFRVHPSKRSHRFCVVHTDKSFIVNIIIIHIL